MARLLFLELNELNFEDIQAYGERLPTLAGLLSAHGYARTTSEAHYEELEPWIQWVTAHTGLPLAEHGVFRLGDIVNHDIAQIWEHLEEQGLRVGAISPMNAVNRCRQAAFFVPDPWTPASSTARPILTRLHAAVAQAVNDNAQARVTPRSAVWLMVGAAAYARPVNYGRYAQLAAVARTRPWAKAMFLDLLLADVFTRETRRRRPDFGSLFLNAGAHIQHHYMFNSAAYDGQLRNPGWYVSDDVDPVLQVYQLYDHIVAQVRRAFPGVRLMIATGLHQDPHPKVTYYWRLCNHEAYLASIGVPFSKVEPRMSRDFLITCASHDDARRAEQILTSAVGEDGVELFEVDNRGCDLFVMLTYPNDIPADFAYRVGNTPHSGLRENVAFVAMKNGQHNGVGYFIDTGAKRGDLPGEFPLAELPSRVCEAFDVPWAPLPPAVADKGDAEITPPIFAENSTV